MSTTISRYAGRGVSSSKEDVHAAIRHIDKGLYPKAFCKIIPDTLSGDPEACLVMHADGAGTKSALAYAYWRETGDASVWKGIAQDAVVMNTDDLLCVGVTGNVLLSSTIGRNKHLIPGEVVSAVINGTVLCDNITGIPRYVYETVVRLDKLIEGTGLDVRIAYRDDGRPIHLPELKNIRLVPLKAVKYFYNLAVLPAYLRRTHAFYVGLASDMLLTKRSVVVLHDIRPLVMDTDKGFFRFKFWVHCLSTKWFAQRVFTVSDNQRHLISEKLGIPLDKIGITYNGWEHMKGVTPDESIFDKMPGVVRGEYYYALGSLAKHKNFKWIREVARRNPDKTFVVAGGKDLRAFGDDTEAKDTHNVFYPGYVSDAENAALMKHCKLFLHPAVFEGFGIPPLEALALGAPIALANATCLPELYGDTARYFDPYDYDTDLDKLAAQPVAAPDEVLQKYSWDRTANFWLHEIEKYAKQ